MAAQKPAKSVDRLRRILAGPWRPAGVVSGETCQRCRLHIFSMDAYVRPGDDLSPALYRHYHCQQFIEGRKK